MRINRDGISGDWPWVLIWVISVTFVVTLILIGAE